jgi:hypothetical protein
VTWGEDISVHQVQEVQEVQKVQEVQRFKVQAVQRGSLRRS